MIQDLRDEFQRYRLTGEKALQQIPDAALNVPLAPGSNTAAVVVRHLSGNFASRFTNFLTTDGEKAWRNRDSEFESLHLDRTELDRVWAAGWRVLEAELARLTDADLANEVTIRGQPLTVHAALTRSVAHAAYHVGQLVLIGRVLCGSDWNWISIPPGQSAAYNAAPTKERRP